MGSMTEALGKHRVILLDTCLWIYHLERHPRFSEVSGEILQAVEEGRCQAVTSELCLMELITGPLRIDRQDVADEYELLLANFPNLRLQPVTRSILLLAAKIRALYGFMTPDAIVMATATLSDASLMVTNDRSWSKYPDVESLCLSELVSGNQDKGRGALQGKTAEVRRHKESGQPTMYLVGLTGGIGSGKSTVATLFSRLGVEVIDADAISRQMVAKGSPTLAKIREHFGDRVLTSAGELDRARLRGLIFHDAAARAWVENLLHPLIRAEIRRRIEAAPASTPYVVLVVPLLLEKGHYDFVDRVLVVDAPEEIQIARVGQRDSAAAEDVRRIIATQLSRRERLQGADDVIDNSGSLEKLEAKVKNLHKKYRQRSLTARKGGSFNPPWGKTA